MERCLKLLSLRTIPYAIRSVAKSTITAEKDEIAILVSPDWLTQML